MLATSEVHAQIAAVWRLESTRIVAALARLLRDLDEAEELAQDALLSALERWPRDGLPDRPAAWLMAIAKNAALDRLRHRAMAARHHEALAFAACHPLLGADARVALTLKVVCGMGTAEIARAFLQSEATVAQRIVRAKRTLAEAGVRRAAPTAPRGWPPCWRWCTSSSTRATRPARARRGSAAI